MLANLCEALSHPVRLDLLRILATQSDCICGDVIKIGSFSQATVLHHLRTLQRAGFVQGDLEGQKRCYQMNPERLQMFKRMVAML